METWLCFLPSLLALRIIQKEMSCFFCKQWNKSAAIVSHASSILLCWRRRWDLDQFFICTSIVGTENSLHRKQSFSMPVCSHPWVEQVLWPPQPGNQAGNLGYCRFPQHWHLQGRTHTIDFNFGIFRAELVQQISVKSSITAIMQDADKYWKDLYPTSNDWSSPNPSESALTGILLEDISLEVNEAVWMHITDSLFLPSLWNSCFHREFFISWRNLYLLVNKKCVRVLELFQIEATYE